MQHLLALPADALLGKFGSGKHAPGSGSAAALMGLLAAKLIVTVGQLTLLRDSYKAQHTVIRTLCQRIEEVLVPQLESLFQEDAEVFDRVIRARRERDAAADQREKRKLANQALLELKAATAIPFQIAETCLELIDLASIVFDEGFKGARGDTGVAVSSAVAGALSAVFVVNLNLKSFKGSYWARQQRKHCDELHSTVVERYQSTLSRVVRLRAEDIAGLNAVDSQDLITTLSEGAKSRYTLAEIEDRAAVVRRLVWRKRAEVWIEEPAPTDPVDLLNPEIALELLGYSFELPDSLGKFRHGTTSFEVAGLLEAQLGRVSISRQMIPVVRRYTAAHELGHVVLHPYLKEAHRDRPLDGSTPARAEIEREADTFASCYLMPGRLVGERFSTMFGTPPFELSDDTAFALLGQSLEQAKRSFRSRRELARGLARTERFNGVRWYSSPSNSVFRSRRWPSESKSYTFSLTIDPALAASERSVYTSWRADGHIHALLAPEVVECHAEASASVRTERDSTGLNAAPVWLSASATNSSGTTSATTRPPLTPPSGPRFII